MVIDGVSSILPCIVVLKFEMKYNVKFNMFVLGCRRVDGETRVGIFAAKDIMVGDSLTYDYRCATRVILL